MHGDLLQLHWCRGEVDRIETITPINLRTKNKSEYLIVKNADGIKRAIRLDRIKRVKGPDYCWPGMN